MLVLQSVSFTLYVPAKNQQKILQMFQEAYNRAPLILNSHEWPKTESPYNINKISTKEVMRTKKNINLGTISWSNTKFSELTL